MFFAATAVPPITCAQNSADKLCSSEWFAAERKQSASTQRSFQLLEGGLFNQNEKTYVLALSFRPGTDSDVEFMVFAASSQSTDFRLVLTEKIKIVDTGELSAQEAQCFSKGAGPFLKASVVDLAGDGNQQIVLESNSVGTCSTCLSTVRVYKAEKNAVTKVVEEFYNDIQFGRGQGLWVHSFRTGNDGHVIPVEKSFFGGKNPQ